MLKNQKKTTFIAVCIAESLSISETQRLVQQLDSNKIHSSHVVVNQLITSPQPEHIQQIQSLKVCATSSARCQLPNRLPLPLGLGGGTASRPLSFPLQHQPFCPSCLGPAQRFSAFLICVVGRWRFEFRISNRNPKNDSISSFSAFNTTKIYSEIE